MTVTIQKHRLPSGGLGAFISAPRTKGPHKLTEAALMGGLQDMWDHENASRRLRTYTASNPAFLGVTEWYRAAHIGYWKVRSGLDIGAAQ